jgi:DNA polymerase
MSQVQVNKGSVLLFLDFETYYDREYSLRKLTPAEYILDPRFECICLGVAKNAEEPFLVDGPDVASFLHSIHARSTTTVTYNALFDNAILAWRFGFVPGRMVDGLGLARALLSHRLRRLGLKDVAEHLGLGEKGDEIHEVVGMHRADIVQNRDLWRRFGAYCLKDTTLLRSIFERLHPEFPKDEYAVMDAVLRCCIEPTFHCDVPLLQQHLSDIRDEKVRLCAAVQADKDEISGNKSFIALLQAQGVWIKTKEGKRGPIPAIAKTDAFMAELLEDDNEVVQCLAAARLGIKSTLEEKRSERLIAISSLPWPAGANLIPIPLRFSGAHTWRLSGDWKINMQNLPSARTGDPVLRKSLLAPEGSKIIVGDLAQIEARLVAWFCGSKLLLDEFAQKKDPYAQLAGQIFGIEVDKATMDGVARHIGKAGILGCGYGMGASKFYESVLRQGRSMLTPPQFEVLRGIWTEQLADASVQTYRRRYFDVRSMWFNLDAALENAWLGKTASRKIGVIEIGYKDEHGYVRGPSGREIRYHAPTIKDGELWYFAGGVPHKIYGASLLENIIQFLARIVMFEIAMRLKDHYGLRFIHQVHDELVFCVEDRYVILASDIIRQEMKRPPAWCQSLPLDCDVGSGQRYGDCK